LATAGFCGGDCRSRRAAIIGWRCGFSAININGNTAAVHFPAVQYDLAMIKSGNQWLVDSGSVMQSYGGYDTGVRAMEAQIANLQPIADGLAAGKYKTAQDVIQAIDKAVGQK
jgi:hypothetical protein